MELLKSNIFINIQANKIINKFEIDFLVNGKIGFEINGLFPHSSKSNNLRWINNQHYKKMISLCDKKVFQYTFYKPDFKNIERLKNDIKQILSNHLFVKDNDNVLKFEKLKYEDAIKISQNTFLTDDSKFAIYPNAPFTAKISGADCKSVFAALSNKLLFPYLECRISKLSTNPCKYSKHLNLN